MAHLSFRSLQYAAWTTAVAPTPIISFISYSSAELGQLGFDPIMQYKKFQKIDLMTA